MEPTRTPEPPAQREWPTTPPQLITTDNARPRGGRVESAIAELLRRARRARRAGQSRR